MKLLILIIAVVTNFFLLKGDQSEFKNLFEVTYNSKKLNYNDTLTVTIKNKDSVSYRYYIHITFKVRVNKDSVLNMQLFSSKRRIKICYDGGIIKSNNKKTNFYKAKVLLEDMPPLEDLLHNQNNSIKCKIYVEFSKYKIKTWDEFKIFSSPKKSFCILYPDDLSEK